MNDWFLGYKLTPVVAPMPSLLFTVSLSPLVVALVVSIVVLPAPIVLGYGIRAAEREERGGGSFH